MTQATPSILTLNGGSSSIKFALYRIGDAPQRGLHGKVDRIGLRGTHFTFNAPARNRQDSRGIGENAPVIRTRICAGLGFLGIRSDENRNAAGEPVVSADASRVQVRVIRTDEDVIVAKAVFRILAGAQSIQHTHSKE